MAGSHGLPFLGLAPAAEDEAAEGEAEAERAEAEGAHRDRLAPRRQPLPAAQRLLLLRGERLPAPLLAQRPPGPEAEVEVVEDLGRLLRHGPSVENGPVMGTRILHVSDLHVGTREAPELEAALARLIEAV